MPLQTLTVVRAARDIQRGRTVAVKNGSPGKIVDLRTDWSGTVYTVEFTPVGLPGATVTMVGLTEGDVETA